MQYRSHDKLICGLSLFISNVVQNVNVIVALHAALCGRILRVALILYNIDKGICALLLIISNVVQKLILLLHCN